MSNTKAVLVGVLSILLLGCASTYRPSPEVSELRSKMAQREAIATLNELLTPRYVELKNAEGETYREVYGFCSASPDRWHSIDMYTPYAAASVTGMKVRVNRRGEYLGLESQHGMVSKVYERIHEDLFLPFGNIKWIKIHRPMFLTSNCFPRNGETELFIREKDSLLHWYVIMVPEEHRARLVAAFMTLVPEVEYVE